MLSLRSVTLTLLLFFAAIIAIAVSTVQAQPVHTSAVTATDPIPLPIEKPLCKIAIEADGIYEIGHAELGCLHGGTADALDNLQLMHQGKAVAYTLIGDADSRLEAGESIRFYGWAFAGSRNDRQFVDHNIFWLWAGGTPLLSPIVNNAVGQYPAQTTLAATRTLEEDNTFTTTFTNEWDSFGLEPDAWYWATLDNFQRTLNITPTISADIITPTQQTLSIELLTRLHSRTADYELEISINQQITPTIVPLSSSSTAEGTIVTADITGLLIAGQNDVDIKLNAFENGLPTNNGILYVNKIDLAFDRTTAIIDGSNTIRFDAPANAEAEYQLSGFETADPEQLLAFNISNPYVPSVIGLTAADVIATSPTVVAIASDEPQASEYLVTTLPNIQSPAAIEAYVAPNLDPVNGAEWVAIAPSYWLTQTQELADYRANLNNISTHVVAWEDVANQYGYGWPVPSAIQSYFTHAYTWETPIQFGLIVGDATHNPRQRPCDCDGSWPLDETSTTHVPTDLLPIGRFIGFVPTDHKFALVDGDDEMPDIAIGRLPADDSAELDNMIAKIMQYETHLAAEPEWIHRVVGLAQTSDASGPHCELLTEMLREQPLNTELVKLCIDEIGDPELLRDAYIEQVNDGVAFTILSAGCSFGSWSNFFETADIDQFNNVGKPMIVVSNGIDGNFAYGQSRAIGEDMLKRANVGSAAHFSRTTLEYSFESVQINSRFFKAIYTDHTQTIGGAVLATKVDLRNSFGVHLDLLDASTLFGDPAMNVWFDTPLLPYSQIDTQIRLPIVINP